MAHKFVRVRLQYAEGPFDPADQWMFDVKIHVETAEILGAYPIFGLNGSVSQGDACPCLLRSDGRIDFGAQIETTSERYLETNLRKRRMIVGEFITISDKEEHTYRIEGVSVLGEAA